MSSFEVETGGNTTAKYTALPESNEGGDSNTAYPPSAPPDAPPPPMYDQQQPQQQPQQQQQYQPQQPVYGTPVVAVQATAFRYGLCDCFDDTNMCCQVCWCPCIQIGRNARIRRGEPLPHGFCDDPCGAQECQVWCAIGCVSGVVASVLTVVTGVRITFGNLFTGTYQFTERQKNKDFFGLPQDPCTDWLLSVCCTCCALIQESRQLHDVHVMRQVQNQAPPPRQYM